MFRFHKLVLALISAGLISMPVVAAPAPAAKDLKISDKVVKIGVMTDLSGAYSAPTGEGSVLAVQMAVEDFKKQYKPSFEIEVVKFDHQNKADVAATKAREWFDTEKVDVVADMPNSAVALAVMEIAKQKDKITLNSGAAATSLTNEKCTDRNVHWVFDTYSYANGTASAIVKNGGKKWYFVTADYAFGHALEGAATQFVKDSGGEVLGSARYPFPGSDFSSFLLKAQSSGADVIGLANAGTDFINSVKQASEFGITPKQSIAALLTSIMEVHSLGLKATQGMYLTEAFYWDRNEETRAWSKRFYEKHQAMPTMIQAGNYSAVLHYLKAIQAAGTDEAGAVMAQMKKTPVNDFFAKNGKIRPDGRMVHDMYLLQIKKPEESKYPWDYAKVVSVIPGEQAFMPIEKSKCPLVTAAAPAAPAVSKQ